jgi:hypothetical protein
MPRKLNPEVTTYIKNSIITIMDKVVLKETIMYIIR